MARLYLANGTAFLSRYSNHSIGISNKAPTQNSTGANQATNHTLQLLSQLQDTLPPNTRAIFLGDGEFDGIELQTASQ